MPIEIMGHKIYLNPHLLSRHFTILGLPHLFLLQKDSFQQRVGGIYFMENIYANISKTG